jgi:hypothetical protein
VSPPGTLSCKYSLLYVAVKLAGSVITCLSRPPMPLRGRSHTIPLPGFNIEPGHSPRARIPHRAGSSLSPAANPIQQPTSYLRHFRDPPAVLANPSS